MTVEKLGKKNNLVKLELSKVIFLSPEYVNQKYQIKNTKRNGRSIC